MGRASSRKRTRAMERGAVAVTGTTNPYRKGSAIARAWTRGRAIGAELARRRFVSRAPVAAR